MEKEIVKIDTPFIRLDALLKFAGATDTGGQAKVLVQSGSVTLNGETCTQRGKKLVPGDEVVCSGRTFVVEKA